MLKKWTRRIIIAVVAVFVIGMAGLAGLTWLNNQPVGEEREVLTSTRSRAPQALVVYQPSRSNITDRVAHQIAQGLHDGGYEVVLNHPGSYLSSDVSQYAVVAFGCPVYMGQVSSALTDYMKRVEGLSSKKVVLFTTGSTKEPVDLDALEKILAGVKVFTREKFNPNDKGIEQNAYNLGTRVAAQ